MSQPRTTVLVVGCGSIGKRHARLLHERDDVDVWVCDRIEAHRRDAEKIAPAARAFDDFVAAVAAGPDAVFICTPDASHRPVAVAALDAGCDVFCEKPLAESVESALAIREAQVRCGRMLQVGYIMRFHPGIARIQQMAGGGELGHLIAGRALVGSYYSLMCSTTPFMIEQPNSLVFAYSHQIDYLTAIFGPATRVSAEAAQLGELDMMPRPNVFALMIRYASGAIGQLHLDFVQYPDRHRLDVIGDAKSVCLDGAELHIFDRGREESEIETFTFERDDLYRRQIEAFLTAARTDRKPAVTIDNGLSAVQIAEAAVKAADHHRAIELPGTGSAFRAGSGSG